MSLPNCLAVRDDTSAQLLEAAVAQSFNAVVITNAEMQGGGPDVPPAAIPISWREVQGFAG